MATTRELLESFGQQLFIEAKAVSKGFAREMELKIDEKSITILGSPYTPVLWKGRRPTKFGAKKGDPTLQETILEWIKRNNIKPNQPNVSDIALSWAMAKSIHMYGTKLYQQGGKQNVYDAILTKDRINSFSTLIVDSFGKDLGDKVTLELKQ
jgi:hypothetical protein